MTWQESEQQFIEWQRLEDEWADKLIREMLLAGTSIQYSNSLHPDSEWK